jgi:Amt family ammonium transporter
MGDMSAFIGLEGVSTEVVWAGTTISAVAFFLFQAMFAGTAATIVSGAVAERIKFAGYIIFAVVIVALIYPFIAHWIWGGGWLSEMGMVDFAGSTVVHLVGGSAALAGAMIVGPRLGKYGKDGKPRVIAGHSIPLAAMGGLILWFGWYGFNPGSQLAMDSAVPMIAVTTTLAAAAGAAMSMIVTWVKSGKPDVGMTINGFLAGLVAITAGCASVSPLSSMMIGAFAGIIVVYAVLFFDRLMIDDPVGAISVHGICGALGTLMVGLFAEAKYGGVSGLLFGGGFGQLWIQLIGVLATFAFVFLIAFGVFKVIDLLIGLRVGEHEETIGLDIGEHGMFAYPDFEIPA